MQDFSKLYHYLLKNNIPNAHAVSNLLIRENLATEKNLEKLISGVPVEHVIGKVDFYGAELLVNSSVLIPRPETELLVDVVAKYLKNNSFESVKLLDVCSGCGCIAVSLKKKFPNLQVYAIELSDEALEVAKKNAAFNKVEVHFIKSDLLDDVRDLKFDVIVSNPPYISLEEYDGLDSSVKFNEPKIALTDGFDGYSIYRRLSCELPRCLNSGAKIFFEIGCNQKNELSKIFNSFFWKNLRFEKDFASHDRFFSLEYAQ